MLDEIQLFWTDFKTALSTKGLLGQIQYLEDATTYKIFAYDTPIKYTCTIWKDSVPSSFTAAYSQAQNDSDKSDFETNYKSTGNQRLTSAIEIFFDALTIADGYTSTSSTSFAPIRATTYTEQTTNAQRSLVYSDTNDTSAGTGARTATITYFDEDLAGPFTETVTLNGTTAVNTVATDICFIERMDVATVGSQLGNLGTLSLMTTTGGGGSEFASIPPGDNETNWVHHYIGASRTARVLSIYASADGVFGGTAHLRCAMPTSSNVPEKTVAPVLRTPPGDQAHMEFPAPISVAGPARLLLYARPASSVATDWVAGLNFLEETS